MTSLPGSRFHLPVHLSSEPSLLLGEGGLIREANTAACSFFGAKDAAVLAGTAMAGFLDPRGQGLLRQRMADAVADGTSEEFPLRLTLGNGSVRDAQVRVTLTGPDDTATWMCSLHEAAPVRETPAPAPSPMARPPEVRTGPVAGNFVRQQRTVLELMARDRPLSEVLDALVAIVESRMPDSRCSILVLEGTRLRHGSAPCLPADYTRAIDGIEIGQNVGCCGAAAWRKQRVVSSDLATDPKWEIIKDLIAASGLVACWSTPVFSGSGEVLGTFGCYPDSCRSPRPGELEVVDEIAALTGVALEKEQNRRRLAESEERFRMLSQVTNDAIWHCDFKDGSLWWNEGLTSLFGYENTEAIPDLDTWAALIHPDDLERVTGRLRGAIQGKESRWGDHYRFRRKDNTWAQVYDRGQIMRNADGVAVRLIGGITDLTERTAAAEKISEQAALLEHASDAILVRALDHKITFWNHGAERLYGWTAAEVNGRPVTSFLYTDLEAFDETLRIVLDTGEWSGEMQHRTRDGGIRHVQARYSLLRTPEGKPRAVLAINSDITARKRLESQFQRARRMESIGTLAGGIAHDLNNVLAPVMMGMDLLRLHLTDSSALETLGMIQDTTRRGAGLIGQLLSFARGVDGQRISVLPADVSREVARSLTDSLPRGLRIAVTETAAALPVNVDPGQLQQALTNLCGNARDAMPDGGEITLHVDHDSPPPAGMSGKWICLTVSDTGPGIPPEIRERIFEPFFSTREKNQSSGLGLATVLAIVKSHDGTVDFQTSESGTRFQIYLPAGAAAADAGPKSPASLPRGRGQTILVVDDEAPVRIVTSRILESFGYRTLTAGDGVEALRIFAAEKKQIAALLTDMMMPLMDGPALVHAIMGINPDLPVIAASGLTSDDKVARMKDAGVTSFLPKPYPTPDLLNMLDGLLRSRTTGGPGEN